MTTTGLPVKAILLLGPTGSGKSPLGDYIAQEGINGCRCLHFDFGHELRRIGNALIAPDGFIQSEHAFIQRVLSEGLLLEDEHFPIAEKILNHFFLSRGFRDGDVLVLNGLPRHTGQAREVSRCADIRYVFVLECRPEDICRRISCNSGGDRNGRTDDSREMIGKKLGIFRQRTEPLIHYYENSGAVIFRIPVSPAATPKDMYEVVRKGMGYHAAV